MFGRKKIKYLEEKVEELTNFEKSVGKIVDNYFEKNKEAQVKFSTEYTVDKFYIFVQSVNEKLKTLTKLEEENAVLKDQIAKECAEHQAFCEIAKKKVDEQEAVINAQSKEIKELIAKAKKSNEKGGKK